MSRNLELAPNGHDNDLHRGKEEQDRHRPRVHFTRELPGIDLPGRVINPIQELLPQYPDIDEEYITTKLGPLTLYEADPTTPFAPETLAIKCVEETGQRPDIIIVCASHLDESDPNNPLKQNAALRTRNALAEIGMADGLDKKTPENTHTFSAACSSFVLALDFLRQTNPVGKNVLIVVDETQYRRTLPPPENDPGKVGLLFSDARTAMQFTYGKDLTVIASEFHHLPEHQPLLTMRVPEYNQEDDYLTAYSPTPGEHFSMDGPRLLRIFGKEITRDILLALIAESGLTEDDIIFAESHQASIRMVELFNKLFPGAVSSEGIRTYGNTSSASVPLDLEDDVESNLIHDGDAGIVFAYGGALAWGAAVIQFGEKDMQKQTTELAAA